MSVSVGSGALNICEGAVVDLKFGGNRQIAALVLGGTNQLSGIYGSVQSPATLKDSHFTGTGTVTVVPPPSLTNSFANKVAGTSAALHATIALSSTNYAVYAYWSTVNGGTNEALWGKSPYVGAWTNAVAANLSYTAPRLTPRTLYHFTFRAANAAGSLWVINVLSFTTLKMPPAPALSGDAGVIRGGLSTFTFPTEANYKYRLVHQNALTDAIWLPIIAPPDFPAPDG